MQLLRVIKLSDYVMQMPEKLLKVSGYLVQIIFIIIEEQNITDNLIFNFLKIKF